MRYDEARTLIQSMMQDYLRRTIERLDREGPLSNYIPAAEENLRSLLAAGPEDYWDIVGSAEEESTLEKITAFSGRPRAEIDASKSDVLELYRAGYLAYWQAVEEYRRKLQTVDLVSDPSRLEPKRVSEAGVHNSATLSEAVDAYIREHSKVGVWVERTKAKQEATLGVLIELLGPTTPMSAIGKAQAQDVKSVVTSMPANKNKNPVTRDLPLREAAKVKGVQTLSPETVNAYLGAFYTFFDWAVKNAFATERLFDGMKVRTRRATSATSDARTSFSLDAIVKMVQELTLPDSSVVKKDCYRWASLIGIFTGARLNEVCSLRANDVKLDDGILCISINEDDPEHRKRLKTAAALRLVPVHSKLIEFGFESFVAERRVSGENARLFPEFAYSPKHGFGRNQGRWFNENFLPALGLKTDQLVFHSLRHTMVTRLSQAGVPKEVVQQIVGHEREGVTMSTYFGAGFTIGTLKVGIEAFTLGT